MRRSKTKGMVIFLKLIELSAGDFLILFKKENDFSNKTNSNYKSRLINKLIVSLFKYNVGNTTKKLFVEENCTYLKYFVNDKCYRYFQLQKYLHYLNDLYFANYTRGPPDNKFN